MINCVDTVSWPTSWRDGFDRVPPMPPALPGVRYSIWDGRSLVGQRLTRYEAEDMLEGSMGCTWPAVDELLVGAGMPGDPAILRYGITALAVR